MFHSNYKNNRCLCQRAVWEVIKDLHGWKTARMLLMKTMTLYLWPTSQFLKHSRKWVHVSWTEVNFPHCRSDGMPPFLSREDCSWAKSYREPVAFSWSLPGIPQPFVHISVSSWPTHWQHLFMLLPKSAPCYMGENELHLPQNHKLLFSLYIQSHAYNRELTWTGSSAELKTPTSGHHTQKDLCAYERQRQCCYETSALSSRSHSRSTMSMKLCSIQSTWIPLSESILSIRRSHSVCVLVLCPGPLSSHAL